MPRTDVLGKIIARLGAWDGVRQVLDGICVHRWLVRDN
jgi:hypothetical protein